MTSFDQDRRTPKRCDANLSPPARKNVAARCVRGMVYALLFILVSCIVTKASTVSLAEYRARIGQATVALDSLSSFDEGVGERERAARIASTLREVRRGIPPKLAVEWNGSAVEINNSWLDNALKEYEKLPPSDAPRREEALRSITERLHALGERLDEVLGKTGGARNKTEEKARLASILRRSEYNRAAEGSAIARLWARIKRWLRSLLPKRKAAEKVEPGHRTPVATNLAELIVIALALAVIAYAAWKLVPRFLRNRGARKRENAEARVVLGEHLAPDETASDILAAAEKLARSGDIRGAIRKGYIALLCELGERKILRLAQHKTNRDYLRALADRRPLYSNVQQLTDTFENHWYGYAPGTDNDWAAFRMHYQQALKEG